MEFRLAEKKDLKKLEKMYLDIVKNMELNNIFIWNEYYPYEEFENDIENQNLWILTANEEIISAIGLFTEIDGIECFDWEEKNAKATYISRLGINVGYLRRGYAKKTLEFAKNFAIKHDYKYIRLLVAEINKPAIKLYLKNGYRPINGVRLEYSPTLNKNITELAFELKI